MVLRTLWVSCSLGLLLGTAMPARAWTSAHVREVKAELDVQPRGPAHVTLDLAVEVEGGWLERLDLPGIDEGLGSDSEPEAFLVREDGSRQSARVKMRGGELGIRFEKSEAPRRGIHHIVVAYDAVLLGSESDALGDGHVRLRYGLPGWESGLSSGEIRFVAPAASVAVADPETAQQLVRESAPDGRSALRFVRVNVPRSSPWSVAIDVPHAVVTAAPAQDQMGTRNAFRSRLLTGAALSLLLLAFAWLVRATARRLARAEGVQARPWGGARTRRGLRSLAALGAVALWPRWPAASASLLVLTALTFVDFYDASSEPLALGRFVPLTRGDLRRSARARIFAWLGLIPWADGGTLLGGAGLLAGVASAVRVPAALDLAGNPWGLGLAGLLVPCFAASRLRRPRSVAEQVGLLACTARSLVTVGSALRLVWYVPRSGRAQQPRLRVLSFTRYPGLLRVELSADSRRAVAPLSLMVVVEADSRVDSWLAESKLRFERTLSEGNLRALHVLRVDDATETLEALFATLAARSHELLVREVGEVRRAA
jgi:hypothetical protein